MISVAEYRKLRESTRAEKGKKVLLQCAKAIFGENLPEEELINEMILEVISDGYWYNDLGIVSEKHEKGDKNVTFEELVLNSIKKDDWKITTEDDDIIYIGMSSVFEGFASCYKDDKWAIDDFIDGSFDSITCGAILQHILYGEIVYG